MRNLLIRKPIRTVLNIINCLRLMLFNRKIDLEWDVRIIRNTQFEGYNKIHSNTEFGGKIGLCSYIGAGANIKASIGRFCSIGPQVYTVLAKHPTETFISTHPSFYSISKELFLTFTDRQKFDEWGGLKSGVTLVNIGNDVFIGARTIIVGSVNIGDGAIVGAGSVVTKDVEPYTIVAGNPARTIRKRFTDKEISLLLQTRWWNNNIEWFYKNADLMDNIKHFLHEN